MANVTLIDPEVLHRSTGATESGSMPGGVKITATNNRHSSSAPVIQEITIQQRTKPRTHSPNVPPQLAVQDTGKPLLLQRRPYPGSSPGVTAAGGIYLVSYKLLFPSRITACLSHILFS